MCQDDIKEDFFIRYEDSTEEIFATHCCRVESTIFKLNDLEEKGLQYIIEETSKAPKVYRPGCEEMCGNTCTFDLQPKFIFIQALGLCNFKCYNCSSGHGNLKVAPRTKRPSKNREVFSQLVDAISKLSYDTTIVVDGSGEIFIHYLYLINKIFPKLENTSIKQIDFETNASCLTKERIDKLYEISKKTKIEYQFRVSVDGITEETFNAVRPVGNFNHTLEMVDYLSKYFTTSINFTIKQPNVQDVPYIDEFFKEKFPNVNIFVEYDYFDSENLKKQLNDPEGKYSCIHIIRN